MGFNDIITKFFGNKSQRDLKEITPYVNKVKAAYPSIETLSNDDLRTKSNDIRKHVFDYTTQERERIAELRTGLEEKEIEERETIWSEIDEIEKQISEKYEIVLEEVLPEVFSIVKETARRFTENETIVVTANDFDRNLATTHDFVRIEEDKAIYQNHWVAGGNVIKWDMIHYDVQLFGGVVLHKGKIAEMATGEGKTLVATLPVFLNALTGNGVHVVTVNDYLSKRDSEWMGPLYMFHGLSVDCIDKHQPNSDERRKAYNADITFGTNNEFGFDYLRDNMARNETELVQRKHNYAIVDEVDSVLIDDARTPLIISGPTPKGEQQEFDKYKPIVDRLYNAQRNLITTVLADARRLLNENPNPKPEEEAAKLLLRAHRGLPKNKALIKYLSEPGIKQLLHKTESFYMAEQNKHMHIIDDELYFVIEEKLNSVDIKDRGIDLVSTNAEEAKFYVIPDIGAEIAELEKQNLTPEEKTEKKSEIYRNFSIASERIHTLNQLLKAYTMFEKDVEYVILDGKIKFGGYKGTRH